MIQLTRCFHRILSVVLLSAAFSLGGMPGLRAQPTGPTEEIILQERDLAVVTVRREESPVSGPRLLALPATGARDRILTSTDGGDNWTNAPLPTGAVELYGIAAGGDTVLAVGENEGVYRSGGEGEEFTEVQASGFGMLRAVASGEPGEWVAVGESILRSSDDGETWEEVTPVGPVFPEWRAVTYDASVGPSGLWVAVGSDGGVGTVWTSADGGETWTERTASTDLPELFAVTADGAGTIVAAGASGSLLQIPGASGEEPVGWIGADETVSEILYAVTALPGGGFLAVGDNGVRISVQADGTSPQVGGPVSGSPSPDLRDLFLFAGLSGEPDRLYFAGTNLSFLGWLDLTGESDFGARAGNSEPLARTFTLANRGVAEVEIDAVSREGNTAFTLGAVQYSTGDGTAAGSLAPGEEATVTVTFDPEGLAEDATYSAAITVTSSAGPVLLDLEARVVAAPSYASPPPTEEWVVGRPFSYTVSVDQPTEDPVAFTLREGDTLPGWMSLEDNGDGTASLSGTPDQAAADADPVAFTLVATTAATGGIAELALSGEVLEPASLSASPLAFGQQAVGSTSSLDWTLTNSGEATLELTAITYPAAVYTDEESFPLSIPGGGSATVSVTFAPSAVQAYQGDATLAFGYGADATVALSGEGIPALGFVDTGTFPATVEAGELLDFTVATTGLPDGHSATIEVVSGQPEWLSLTDHGNGTATLTGTPLAPHIGEDVSMVLRVTDSTSGDTTTTTLATTVMAPSTVSSYAVSLGVPHGPSALAEADPDGDGAVNLLEFAMGSDPGSGGSRPTVHGEVVVAGESYPAIRFLRRSGGTENGASYEVNGLVYTVESSSDLETWDDAVARVSPTVASPSAPLGFQWVTYRRTLPLSTEPGFLRVHLSEAEAP